MQWQTLAAGALDETLSVEEQERLLILCKESREAREALVRVAMVNRLLPLVLNDPVGVLTAQEVVLRLEAGQEESMAVAFHAAERARRWVWKRRLQRFTATAAVLSVLVLGLWWTMTVTAPAAALGRTEAVHWVGEAPKFDNGVMSRGTKLKASIGLAEINFESGAKMVAEAPFDIELRSPKSFYLKEGRVSIRCPKSAHGFTVHTPMGEVTDLGTEFCVGLSATGLEVHVLSGVVETRTKSLGRTMLFEGEALSVTSEAEERVQADPSAFLTAMPQVNHRKLQYVHWGFNDRDTVRASDGGRGFRDELDTSLNFRVFPGSARGAQAKGPQLVPGIFGQAASLNGVSAYGETLFPGISGNAPRTVSLWVKVPKDLKSGEGHGILSWGTLRNAGVWQLSANAFESDGPMGCVRVGTYNNGMIIGSTDLRDDRWHHIAVVMYGGSKPNLATNVLFYVDGKPEKVSRKTLTEINTNVADAPHGVWMGRNIVAQGTNASNYGFPIFFRGTVDEVFIFDSPLSHQDILKLMHTNQPPS